MEVEVELLAQLLFIFGLLFLLWVGQEVVIYDLHVQAKKNYQYIINITPGVYMQHVWIAK